MQKPQFARRHRADMQRPHSDKQEEVARAEMSAEEAVAFIQLCEQHEIEIFIDGGWGVDALLGEQTRQHRDLDIALQQKDATQLRPLLEEQGYREIPRDTSWNCNYVLGDGRGHEIDVHTFAFDEYRKPVFGVAYPLESLTGHGSIQGHPVRCIAPEWMVRFHSGYRLTEKDYHDVSALCAHFNIELPPAYRQFQLQSNEHK